MNLELYNIYAAKLLNHEIFGYIPALLPGAYHRLMLNEGC
jgi:hypothetical protein